LSIAAFALAGVAQVPIWNGRDPEKYLTYVFAALMACGLRVRRPGSKGVVTMNYLFILLALLDLNLIESVVIGGTAVLILGVAQRGSSSVRLTNTLTALLCTESAILASQIVYHLPYLSSEAVEPAIRFVATALACFVAYNLPEAATLALTQRADWRELWNAFYVWTLPYYLLAGALIGLYSSTRPTMGWQSVAAVLPFVILAFQSYRMYVKRFDAHRDHSQRVQSLLMRTIETLAMAIGAKDRQMEGHLQRVQVYAMALGRELKLSDAEMKALEAAALLHDIGKLAVPEHIISKPGRLTPEEFERMKIHPVVGAEILTRVHFPYPVVPYVRHHHERWDGSGYPDGLRGDEIPIGARILTVVDSLDALSSDRQYRRALPLERAVEQVVQESGRAFDPRIVAILKRRFREIESLSESLCCKEAEKAASAVSQTGRPAQPFDRVVKAIGASTDEMHALFELSQELGNSLNLAETFAVLGPAVRRLVHYSALVIYLRRRDRLYARHVAGEHLDDANQLELSPGEGLSGKVVETGEAIVNGNPEHESQSANVQGKLAMFRSALSVPLTGADSIIGCMTLYHEDADAFTQEHLRRLQALLPKLSQAVENGMRFKNAEDKATTDHLTGLPNAHSLYLHLDQEIALSKCMNSPLTVVVCDLNGFKAVNDTLGHLTGNRLLQAVGAGLKESCREYDFVARMGGDEFALVLSGLATGQDVQTKIRQFREAVRTSSVEISRAGMVRGSFGVAMFPNNGQNADQLLAHADREMYRDKEEQKRGARVGWDMAGVLKATATLSKTPVVSKVRSSVLEPERDS
jgi:diguanylate cyclase (GGDEF)-like protein/putative nucleotidyltransferase with HDIG domain